jgi:phosphatidylethanolamine/phosphatidyl-N-methylethanolamine N-methyltransferase
MAAMPKLLAKEDGIFFARWLRSPLRTASVMPSGAALARLMAREVDPSRPGAVLELGGGTGVITAAILARGLEPSRLFVIERDPVFHRLLTRRFPGVTIMRDDAENLKSRLEARGVERLAAVVSGLPMLAITRLQQKAILQQCFALLERTGSVIQFTYGPDSPISRRRLADWGLTVEPVGRAWLNLPPATVWRFKRR